eukprot:TRINITY_DN1238_c0_g1_i1.p1 TRINITY_DN1238_c0_g1~~TRINITY_DN1238_c0_g1_i1.p1  ORF type:complete len:136 (-),score=4.21 TRINITY_DN1238_c0_g1_i1:160-567(-)
MDAIRRLIHDYSTAVRESLADLLATYPTYRMIPRDLQIPQRGILPSGRTYKFHGIGCRFVKHGIVVDMDFGIVDGELRTDGFDAWRLRTFASSCHDLLTVDEIQSGLDKVHVSGEIIKAVQEYSGLYFPVKVTAK